MRAHAGGVDGGVVRGWAAGSRARGADRRLSRTHPGRTGVNILLPARFVGAWERGDLEVDGSPVSDAGRAVWIEAGAAYVDVRGTGGFAGRPGFAGPTAWGG